MAPLLAMRQEVCAARVAPYTYPFLDQPTIDANSRTCQPSASMLCLHSCDSCAHVSLPAF